MRRFLKKLLISRTEPNSPANAPFDVEAAVREVHERICAASIRGEPFTHSFIEQVLPAHVFEGVMRYWPDAGLFDREERRTNHFFIKSTDMPAVIRRMEAESANFWRAACPVLDSVNSALASHFDPALRTRFGDGYAEKMNFYGRWNLMLDRVDEDYSIHVDSPPIAVAGILYLPNDDSQEGLGTVMYAHRDPEFRHCGAHFFSSKQEREMFTEVGRSPFKPNAMFSFANNAKAFHGVDTLTRAEEERRSILFRYWINPDSFDALFGKDAYANIKKRTPELEAALIASMRKVETWPLPKS